MGFRAGPGEASQAAPAGPEPVAQVRAPEFEPSLRSAALRTSRVRSGTSLLAPSRRPRPPWATHPAALRPQTPEWLPEPAEPPGSSDPPRALRGCPVASLRTSLRFVRFPESFSYDRVLRFSSPRLQIRFRGEATEIRGSPSMAWINYFVTYLKAFPPTERGNPRARPSPNSNILNPNNKQ